MKYALISDVHANLEALRAVLERIDALGAQRILCLGDLVGYNADPGACIELLEARGIRSIVGNHDRAAVGTIDPGHFGRNARHAIIWTRQQLRARHRSYLERLPLTYSTDGFMAVHGALHPRPNDRLHLSTPQRIEASFDQLVSGKFGVKLCFFGHTHRGVAHEHDGTRFRSLEGDKLELHPDRHYLVNPGSVGQPRDGDERAAFALYDTGRRTIEFCRVAYDVEAMQDKRRKAGLDESPSVWERSTDWVSDLVDEARELATRAWARGSQSW